MSSEAAGGRGARNDLSDIYAIYHRDDGELRANITGLRFDDETNYEDLLCSPFIRVHTSNSVELKSSPLVDVPPRGLVLQGAKSKIVK